MSVPLPSAAVFQPANVNPLRVAPAAVAIAASGAL